MGPGHILLLNTGQTVTSSCRSDGKKMKIGNLVTVVDPLQCSNVFLGASQVASWEDPESPVLCVIVCHHNKPTGSIGICKVLNSLGFSKSRVIAIIKGFQVRRKKYKKMLKG